MDPTKTFASGLVWFRRDLRADDQAALYHALKNCSRVHCVFVFDTDILEPLPRADRRVEFIRESLVELDAALRLLAGGDAACGLIVRHAAARTEVPKLARELGVQAVFLNHDDEPAALARDAQVRGALADAGISLRTSKDHVIFERDEVVTLSGTPFSVFTPYKNAWLKKVDAFYLKPYPVERYAAAALAPRPEAERRAVPTLAEIAFERTNLSAIGIPTGASGADALLDDFFERIDQYAEARDYPAVKGMSYLSVHLRFGTVSIRRCASIAHQLAIHGNGGAATWLSELIWRDFYHQILAHHPRIAEGEPCSDAAGGTSSSGASFKPAYDTLQFERGKVADARFAAWCEGRTGYPLVDAAMAQINDTGYMHNRLRMVTAGFLIKDLGIDWRRGERYFAEKLNDYDLASNNGGWQWAASTGCDAQPYFRIFNPVSQSERFDPHGHFIRRWLPQLSALSGRALHAPWKARADELQAAGVVLGETYPRPIVDHDAARDATLARYAAARKPKDGAAAAQPRIENKKKSSLLSKQ